MFTIISLFPVLAMLTYLTTYIKPHPL